MSPENHIKNKFHPLLDKLLKKHLGQNHLIPDEYAVLFEAIDQHFHHIPDTGTNKTLDKEQQNEASQLPLALLERSDAPVWITNGEGALMIGNRVFRSLFSLLEMPELPINSDASEFIKKFLHLEWDDLRSAVFKTGKKVLRSEIQNKGETAHFETTVTQLTTGQGAPAFGFVCHEISDSVSAARRISENEASLNMIINNFPGAIFSVNKNYLITAANTAAKDHSFMVTKQEMKVGDHFFKNGAPEKMRTDWQNYIDRSLKGEQFTIEENHHFEGKEVIAEMSFHPIFENEKVTGVGCFGRDVTAEKRNSVVLRQKNELFNLVIRATNDIIWDYSVTDNRIHWSDAYEKQFGHDDSSISPLENWLQKIHPDEREKIKNSLHHLLYERQGDFWEEEYRYLKADGSYAFVYDRGYVLYDKERRAVRMVGAMQDITKRKLAEQKLERSEVNLKAILENTDTGYILVQPNGRILSFNERAVQLGENKFCQQLQKGMFFPEAIVVNRREEVKGKIAEVVSAKRKTKYKVNYTIGNESAWLEIAMQPITGNDGNISAVSIAMIDITHRKMVSEQLRKSRANLRTMLDNTSTSYVMLDKEQNVMSFNQAAYEGYKKEMKIHLKEGINFYNALPFYMKPQARILHAMVMSGEKVSYEFDFRQSDNSINWYHMQVFPVKDSDDRVFGGVIAGVDITEQKNTAAEKEKLREEMVLRNKDLEQFAYIISHNLRSPVANISGLVHLLQNPLNDNDRARCLEGLGTSAKKLDNIISDLNEILQTKKSQTEGMQNVMLSALISDIKDSIRDQVDREGVVIKLLFAPQLHLYTIRSYMQSIFYNLLVNSIKYRRAEEPPVITIQIDKKEKEFEIIYTDNGLGFDMSVHGSQIFGLYKRFHAHREGRGMGLYMIKTQVEILGGTITLSSEPGKGSCFIIRLPSKSPKNLQM